MPPYFLVVEAVFPAGGALVFIDELTNGHRFLDNFRIKCRGISRCGITQRPGKVVVFFAMLIVPYSDTPFTSSETILILGKCLDGQARIQGCRSCGGEPSHDISGGVEA